MTDLHSHILPGIDDGAKDVVTSMRLLQMELDNKVDQLVVTPHFNSETMTVKSFIQNRNGAVRALSKALEHSDIRLHIKVGAEVYFSPMLVQFDVQKLCLQGTRYLLIELPVTQNPAWVRDVFFSFQQQNIIPVLAHVERYPYVLENPDLLYELVEGGAIAQVNASSIVRDDKRTQMIYKFIKWNLAHVIATDTHSVKHRPPHLLRAAQMVADKFDRDTMVRMQKNARGIFEGKTLLLPQPHKPKEMFGRYV